MISTNTDKFMETNAYLDQYTSENEISKYARVTAGSGISYLLDHDYKAVYLEALNFLPKETEETGHSYPGIWLRRRDESPASDFDVNSQGIRVARPLAPTFRRR